MTTHKEWKCPVCGSTDGPVRILQNVTVREKLEFDEFEDGSFDVYPTDTCVIGFIGQVLYECDNSTCKHKSFDVGDFLVEAEDETGDVKTE